MTFSRLVRYFGENQCILKGRAVHARITTSGFHLDVYTNNHLVSMYLKFNLFDDAWNLFDRMTERNMVSYTTLISGFSHMGLSEEALLGLRLMVFDGFDPNQFTYAAAISACTSLGAVKIGKEIHGRIYRMEEELGYVVNNCLINFYGKCGLLKSARSVFDKILEPNIISWTSMFTVYCQSGEDMKGLKLFAESRKVGIEVNEFSCASAFGAYASLENLKGGIQLHSLVFRCGVGLDQFVITSLIKFYTRCGELDSARQVFLEIDNPNLSAYNALIGGCIQLGNPREAIELFYKLHSLGLKPNDRTFSSLFGAIVDMVEIEVGKQTQSLILKFGFMSCTFVGNAILDFYSNFGLLEESMRCFEEIDRPDTVSWNTLMTGRIKMGHHTEAIGYLENMLIEGFEPNNCTYSIILNISGDLPSIQWGKQTHCRILKPGFNSDVVIGSALIDMYSKCGRLNDARKVFDCLISKNLVTWNTIIIGYAQHGFGKEALEIYNFMQQEGVKPNDITFIGVLSACGHMGLLEEGLSYFHSMFRDHGISPRMDHLGCLVSLLSRKGQTERAYEFIRCFNEQVDKVVWRCLLSGCKTNKDFSLGKYAAEKILSIDPDDTSAHVMLSNIFAEAKMWEETAQVRKIMKEKALKKDCGYSWFELNNRICSFGVGENLHFEGSSLLDLLSGLMAQLFDAGYVPDTAFSFQYKE